MKIAIFHFNPLELYPPATNFLECLEKTLPKNTSIKIFTLALESGHMVFKLESHNFQIVRLGKSTKGSLPIGRYFQYFKYYFLSILKCIQWKPDKVLYFESLSALPVYVLMKLFKGIEVFAHFHEYMTPQEYKRMWLNEKIYALEKRSILPKAVWISHTNIDRLDMFLKDREIMFNKSKHHIFPNYPPKSWLKKPAERQLSTPISFVYVGSFSSLDKLYIKEVLAWMMSLHKKATLDVYSFNIPDKVRNYVKSLKSAVVTLHEAQKYSNLSGIIARYDIGLIIYSATEKNVVYSAPNKLFEYLSCGLDVWYPKEMIGCHTHNSETYWPKVVPLDFNRLYEINFNELVSRKANKSRVINFTCEAASKPLIDRLMHHD